MAKILKKKEERREKKEKEQKNPIPELQHLWTLAKASGSEYEEKRESEKVTW